MVNFSSIKKRFIIILVLIVLVVILVTAGSILYLNSGRQQKQIDAYSSLIKEMNSLSSDPTIANDSQYNRMIDKFKESRIKKTEKDKYDTFLQSIIFLHGLYSYTNNPKLYKLQQNLIEYAEITFPQYKEEDFSHFCQDPSCAEEPQAKEISDILQEVKVNDGIRDRDKESLIRDITNIGYLGKEDRNSKALSYLAISFNIKGSPEASNSAYLSIAEKIESFVKKTYPDVLKESGIKI